MTTFDRREGAFENMFAHEEEMDFQAGVRRTSHLAAWAARLMSETGDKIDTEAQSTIVFTTRNGGEQALITRSAGIAPPWASNARSLRFERAWMNSGSAVLDTQAT